MTELESKRSEGVLKYKLTFIILWDFYLLSEVWETSIVIPFYRW